MHLRCVCVLLLVGVDVIWAGLTRELSSYFLLVNFKIVEGHYTDRCIACDFYHFKVSLTSKYRNFSEFVYETYLLTYQTYLRFILEDFNQVFYLGFDRYNGDRLYDDSLHNNNATLKSAFLDKIPGSCGRCARVCCGGTIPVDGAKFVGEYCCH